VSLEKASITKNQKTMSAAFVQRNASRRLLSPLLTRPKRTLNICWINSSSTGSSDSHSGASNAIQVPPPPSWSVSELRLSSTDDAEADKIISEEELAVLARRCLIDVRRLSPERRDQLRVDIAGIMRCASVLLDSKNLSIDADGDGDNNNASNTLTDQEIYDNPRGLGRMPVRRNTDSKHVLDDWRIKGSKESKAILDMKSVKTKMVIKDNERFFEVVTKR
jgi:hypothetical protein